MKHPKIPKNVSIMWRVLIIALFIVSACLLYLLNCSDVSWRIKWSVVKVDLPSNDWGTISNQARLLSDIIIRKGASKDNDNDNNNNSNEKRGDDEDDVDGNEEKGEVPDNKGQGSVAGSLSVNMWGWCLQDSTKAETICSGASMLFDLDDLLGDDAKSNGLSGKDFNFLLLHGLVIHGIAMVSTMTALIPISINTFRTIRSKILTLESSWFEHGTLLTGCVLCLIAYVIDKMLNNSVNNNLPNYKVTSGQGLIVAGIATLLILITLLISGIPPFYFHMKRQSQLVRYWEDLEDHDEALDSDNEDDYYGEDYTFKRKKKKRKKRGLKRSRSERLAKMVFGEDGLVERGGSLYMWRSRRRDRRRMREDWHDVRGKRRYKRERRRRKNDYR
ncbi:uncharacterized protein L201_001939 [Kwoniella dendrophila CBS 6074]|uniref:Uncharacterized protein n=1 Tax=Kwoniella dendrophila CBS 6074 TaxID=1295534 RepID=A0AAX4JQP8_9TREE